jgi:hypothetical protein
MLRILAVALLVLVTVAFVTGIAADKTHNYVGADKCKICHKGEAKGMVWETWEKSAHSKAYQTLVDKKDGSEKNAKCLACHSTGFSKPTGYAVTDSTKALTGVGCEACHGPGADYKAMNIMKDKAKAKEAGLMTPNEATCKVCHNENATNFDKTGFKFDEFWKKIQHPVKAAATGK